MKITVEYGKTEQAPLRIISAKYKNNYAVELVFNDNRKRLVKFGSFLKKTKHPIIRSYLKEEKFKKFYIDSGNIAWGKNWDLIFPIEQIGRAHV